ncbi:MAG: hypothetical protein LBT16_07565 [Treponema sp.]|jgi:hypothetical protein|nr:hypothetical protein [Treponema sp.]
MILFLLGTVFSAAAQDESEDEEAGGEGDGIPVEDDWIGPPQGLYAAGDKAFVLSLGALFPVLFFNNANEVYAPNYPVGNIHIGGTGSLGFLYFISPAIFLGAEVQGSMNSTLAQNMFYMVPIGVKAGYQFLLSRFEFPLSLLVGMMPQAYSNNVGYFGLVLKPEASFYFRFNNDWSFGLNGAWWWVPQWPKTEGSEHNRYANFLELSLTVRFHF